MCKRLSDWVSRLSNRWVAALAMLAFMAFTAFVLPGQAEQAEAFAGGAGAPDTSLFYSPSDLYRMAEAYGEAGRAAYVRARFTFDLIWPLVYTVFLASGISWIYRKAFLTGGAWARANLAPIFAAGFDYLENISTSIVMIRYPLETPVIDVLASIFTPVKWALVGLSFSLLLLGGVLGAWRVLRKGRS
jgi:hypothetical protein